MKEAGRSDRKAELPVQGCQHRQRRALGGGHEKSPARPWPRAHKSIVQDPSTIHRNDRGIDRNLNTDCAVAPMMMITL